MCCSKRYKRNRIVVLFLLIFFTCFDAQSQRPNIIYIMTDDMGYGDLSCYGRKDYQTPNLDKLASQGARLVNAYAAAALCTPTRTAFMTGKYPARTPVGLIEPLTATKADSVFGLTAEIPSLASKMKASGYETALIGKWHLGVLPQHNPIKNGYEYFFGILSGAADHVSHKNVGRTHDLYENDQPVFPKGYMTNLFAQKSVEFIKQKHNKPFFLTIMFTAPHWPWQAPGDGAYPDSLNFRNGGSAATYGAMIKSMDDAVGEILRALDDENLSDQTIVIFTNDNGGEKYSDNGGLSKGKNNLWEGGISVPAMVRWPGKISAGSVCEQVVITMDWTKTILSAGEAKAQDHSLDGINLLPILSGKKQNTQRTLYWRSYQRAKQKAIRMGDWKYLQDENGEYLFNLAVDKAEKNDLKEKEKAIFDRLKKKYAEWEKTVLQPIALQQ
jgi:arylsulfatase A-like enzyme